MSMSTVTTDHLKLRPPPAFNATSPQALSTEKFKPFTWAEVRRTPKPIVPFGWFGELIHMARQHPDLIRSLVGMLDRLPLPPDKVQILQFVATQTIDEFLTGEDPRHRPKRVNEVRHSIGEPFYRAPADEVSRQERMRRLDFIKRSATESLITPSLHLYQFEVPVARLPMGLDGLSILHLTDLHFKVHNISRMRNLQLLAEYLKNKGLSPEITCLTGDVISDQALDLYERPLRILNRVNQSSSQLRFQVLGNHDYYQKAGEYVTSALACIGYRDLNNRHQRLKIGGHIINLWGVGDLLEGQPQVPYTAAAHGHEVNILLAHNLDAVNKDYPDVFDLILSGHMHGGEVPYGNWAMELTGYAVGLNDQVSGWKALTDRALSYIGPGMSRHWLPEAFSPLVSPCPGAAIITLRSAGKLY